MVPFLRAARALWPAGMSIRCGRADSGFFEEAERAFLAERALSHVVVARLTTQLKRRAAVFVCGAILGRSGRQVVLHLAASWGGRAKHKPLLEAVLGGRNSTAPKLVPPEDQAACAPCRT